MLRPHIRPVRRFKPRIRLPYQKPHRNVRESQIHGSDQVGSPRRRCHPLLVPQGSRLEILHDLRSRRRRILMLVRAVVRCQRHVIELLPRRRQQFPVSNQLEFLRPVRPGPPCETSSVCRGTAKPALPASHQRYPHLVLRRAAYLQLHCRDERARAAVPSASTAHARPSSLQPARLLYAVVYSTRLRLGTRP